MLDLDDDRLGLVDVAWLGLLNICCLCFLSPLEVWVLGGVLPVLA